MPTRRNPTVPRLEYVAQNFTPFVLAQTVRAWIEATGSHGLSHPLFFADTIRDQDVQDPERLIGRLEGLATDKGLPLSSPTFDKYLPWYAREFNRGYKPLRKANKRQGLSTDWPRGYKHKGWLFRGPVLHETEGTPYYETLVDLEERADEMMDTFGLIGDWAERTGADLNKYSWEEALLEAQYWLERRREEMDVEEGEVVYEWDDGWTAQTLASKRELVDESDAMGHCTDEPGYEEGVASGEIEIFSLRDPKGLPHVTIEWIPEERFMKQVKGKGNKRPKDEYLARAVDFRINYLDEPSDELRPIPTPEEVRALTHPGDFLGTFRYKGEPLVLYTDSGWWEQYNLDSILRGLRKIGPDNQYWDIASAGGAEYPADVPQALEWAVWRDHGKFPYAVQDEMVKFVQAAHLAPPGAPAENPARNELKKKLMR